MSSDVATQNQTASQVATRDRSLKGLLNGADFKSAVQAALPRHLTAERFIRVAITGLTRIPKLQSCTPESFFKCLLDLSAMGLEPDGRRAHLIPYGTECTLIVDYKGIVELVRRSGEVSYIHADVVYEGDEFDFKFGSGAFLTHKPNLDGERKKRRAVYSFVKMKDGSEDFFVWGMAQVEAIRQRSKSKDSGPWKTDYDEMAKKSVFRNQSKWLPFSSEVKDAIERDDDQIAFDTTGGFEIHEGSKELQEKAAAEKIAELRARGAQINEVKGQLAEGEAAPTEAEIPAHTKDLMSYRDKIGDADFYRIIKKHGFEKPDVVPVETVMALVADMEEVLAAKKQSAKDAAKDKPKFGGFGGGK